MDIKLQTQFDDESCMAACVAMVIGKDVNDLVGFHESYMEFESSASVYIEHHGFNCELLNIDAILLPGYAYIAMAPSPNQFAKMHAVVIDIDYTGKINIHDPTNREMKYVIWNKEVIKKDECRLVSWIPIYRISKKEQSEVTISVNQSQFSKVQVKDLINKINGVIIEPEFEAISEEIDNCPVIEERCEYYGYGCVEDGRPIFTVCAHPKNKSKQCTYTNCAIDKTTGEKT